MKISVEEAIRTGINRNIIIRLNGITLKHCVYADEENGFVIVLDIDEYKRLSRSIDYPEIPRKMIKGNVWIMLGDRK